MIGVSGPAWPQGTESLWSFGSAKEQQRDISRGTASQAALQ